jgi:hypothetical protein
MAHTSDKTVLHHIEELVAEEKTLYAKGGVSEDDKKRLDHINVQLDQAWDLLRQRRALREFGKNPDDAEVRPPRTVENYTG